MNGHPPKVDNTPRFQQFLDRVNSADLVPASFTLESLQITPETRSWMEWAVFRDTETLEKMMGLLAQRAIKGIGDFEERYIQCRRAIIFLSGGLITFDKQNPAQFKFDRGIAEKISNKKESLPVFNESLLAFKDYWHTAQVIRRKLKENGAEIEKEFLVLRINLSDAWRAPSDNRAVQSGMLDNIHELCSTYYNFRSHYVRDKEFAVVVELDDNWNELLPLGEAKTYVGTNEWEDFVNFAQGKPTERAKIDGIVKSALGNYRDKSAISFSKIDEASAKDQPNSTSILGIESALDKPSAILVGAGGWTSSIDSILAGPEYFRMLRKLPKATIGIIGAPMGNEGTLSQDLIGVNLPDDDLDFGVAQGITTEHYADDSLAFMDALGVAGVDLIVDYGHSMGGARSLYLLLQIYRRLKENPDAFLPLFMLIDAPALAGADCTFLTNKLSKSILELNTLIHKAHISEIPIAKELVAQVAEAYAHSIVQAEQSADTRTFHAQLSARIEDALAVFLQTLGLETASPPNHEVYEALAKSGIPVIVTLSQNDRTVSSKRTWHRLKEQHAEVLTLCLRAKSDGDESIVDHFGIASEAFAQQILPALELVSVIGVKKMYALLRALQSILPNGQLPVSFGGKGRLKPGLELSEQTDLAEDSHLGKLFRRAVTALKVKSKNERSRPSWEEMVEQISLEELEQLFEQLPEEMRQDRQLVAFIVQWIKRIIHSATYPGMFEESNF